MRAVEALRGEGGEMRTDEIREAKEFFSGDIKPEWAHDQARSYAKAVRLGKVLLSRLEKAEAVCEAAKHVCLLRGDVTPGDRADLVNAVMAWAEEAK